MDERRVTFGDRTYELRPWSVDDGQEWAMRFARFVAAATGGVSAVMHAITDRDWRELCAVAFKYTQIVERDDNGNELVHPLTKRREAMRGRWSDIARLVRAHVEVEFSGFFADLPDIINVGEEPEPAPVVAEEF